MKLDQQAYAIYSDEQEQQLKAALGLTDPEGWIHDEVTANSFVMTPSGAMIYGTNVAKLQFNYSLGVELELLRYVFGPNFHELTPLGGLGPFTSHAGFHLEDDEPFPTMEGYPLIQETWTIGHTAKYLTDPESKGYGRKYHYRIHQLTPGTVVKFIKRVNP